MGTDKDPWSRLIDEVVSLGEQGRPVRRQTDEFERSFAQFEKAEEIRARAREAHRKKQGLAIEKIVKGIRDAEEEVGKEASSKNLVKKAFLLDELLMWNAWLPVIAFEVGNQAREDAWSLIARALALGHDAGDLNHRLDDLHYHFAEFCEAHVSQLLEKAEADCRHESYPIDLAEIRKRAAEALTWATKAVESIDCIVSPRPSQKPVFCSMEAVDPACIIERKEHDEVIVITEDRIEKLQAIYFLMVELQVMLGDGQAAGKLEEMANKLYKTHWPKALKRGEKKPIKTGFFSRLFQAPLEAKPEWTKVGASREKWKGLVKGFEKGIDAKVTSPFAPKAYPQSTGSSLEE